MAGTSKTWIRWPIVVIVFIFALCLTACSEAGQPLDTPKAEEQMVGAEAADVSSVPEFSGEPYVTLHDNKPFLQDGFSDEEVFERYSPLDELGRCGAATACIGRELMPDEKRGAIGQVKPSGWQTVKYDIVEGRYLYNRCHLLGYQLTGENANPNNLITGTRYLNVEGMLPFENQIAEYIEETGHHVWYRVTPIFKGKELIARGVTMEAYSIEDKGEGICFCVYCYNVQPGIEIFYADGSSKKTEDTKTVKEETSEAAKKKGTKKGNTKENTKENNEAFAREQQYVLNKNTKKFHYPDCSSVAETKEYNKKEYTGNRQELIEAGYEPCGRCLP